MIYIASPYSSPIVGAQDLRFQKVRRFAIHLFNQGAVPFSPIVYAHEMAAVGGLNTSAAAWLAFNSDILRRCEAMFVYTLPGWKESKGVQMEIKQARALLMNIVFFDENFNVIDLAPGA